MAEISTIQGAGFPGLTGQSRAADKPAPEQTDPRPVREALSRVNGREPRFEMVDIQAATAELQQHLESLGTQHSVGFRSDPGTGSSVIEIRDGDGNLIRQFPPEKLLNLREKLVDLSGMVIDTMT